MAIEFSGGLGLDESDLPEVSVQGSGSGLSVTVGNQVFYPGDDDTPDVVLEAVTEYLAYWLWAKRNPEYFVKADPEIVADIVSVLESTDEYELEGIAEVLAKAGFRRA